MKQKILYNYPVLVTHEEGKFIATCPSFPGCVCQMSSHEKAIEEITEGIKFFITTYRKKGWALPEDSQSSLTLVKIAVNE